MTINIQILGTGCPKCKKLTAVTESAAEELGLDYNIEKITDINAITSMGVLLTPALLVDGEVKLTGKVPSLADLKFILQ